MQINNNLVQTAKGTMLLNYLAFTTLDKNTESKEEKIIV